MAEAAEYPWQIPPGTPYVRVGHYMCYLCQDGSLCIGGGLFCTQEAVMHWNADIDRVLAEDRRATQELFSMGPTRSVQSEGLSA